MAKKSKNELTMKEAAAAVYMANEEADAALEAAREEAEELNAAKHGAEVEADIFEKAEAAQKEFEEKKQELSLAVDALIAAREEAESAKLAGDRKAFKAAKEKEDDAQFNRDVVARKVAELRGPLVTEREYKIMADAVYDKYRYEAKKYKKRVHDLIEQCVDICQEYKKMMDQADKTLETLQTELYKKSDIPEGFKYDKDYFLKFRDRTLLLFVEETINIFGYDCLLEKVNPRNGMYALGTDVSRHKARRYV